MTLLVDRRKDNYDELLMLAQDRRVSRGRTQRWTTALVVGAVGATGLYIATMNQQVSNLQNTATEAEQNRDVAELAYERIVDERDALRLELDGLRRYQDLYAQIMPTDALTKSISRLTPRIEGGEPRVPGDTAAVTKFALSNVVWMVDGSRRFPVIGGDILWIPDAKFWIEYNTEVVGDTTRYSFTRHDLDRANVPTPGTGRQITLPYKTAAQVGSSDCVEIKHHPQSLRPLFRSQGYGDIEVTYFKSDDTNPCENE